MELRHNKCPNCGSKKIEPQIDYIIRKLKSEGKCYCEYLRHGITSSKLNPYWCNDCKKDFDNQIVLPEIKMDLSHIKCDTCRK